MGSGATGICNACLHVEPRPRRGVARPRCCHALAGRPHKSRPKEVRTVLASPVRGGVCRFGGHGLVCGWARWIMRCRVAEPIPISKFRALHLLHRRWYTTNNMGTPSSSLHGFVRATRSMANKPLAQTAQVPGVGVTTAPGARVITRHLRDHTLAAVRFKCRMGSNDFYGLTA